MWTTEHKRTIDAGITEIFEAFADVTRWPEWNAGAEWVELDGPFAAGTTGRMKIPDQDALAFTLVWVDPTGGFEDATPIEDAGIVVRVRHSLWRLDGGRTLVRYTTTIDGPAADELGPVIGPEISGDFPAVLEALAKRVEKPKSEVETR
jgi:hypothetical protein